jgi:hypothetical protein
VIQFTLTASPLRFTNVTEIKVEPSTERSEEQSAEDEGTNVIGAAVGKAVTVDMGVDTDKVAGEWVNSGFCVDGEAVTASGSGRQADTINPAAITRSNNGFRNPRKNG